MKKTVKISILAFLLCVGFIPTSTGASFEPAKTALYLGENNPGNYSLLQYAIAHGSAEGKHLGLYNSYGTHDSYEAPLMRTMMNIGHRYQVPFHLIGLLFSDHGARDTQ